MERLFTVSAGDSLWARVRNVLTENAPDFGFKEEGSPRTSWAADKARALLEKNNFWRHPLCPHTLTISLCQDLDGEIVLSARPQKTPQGDTFREKIRDLILEKHLNSLYGERRLFGTRARGAESALWQRIQGEKVFDILLMKLPSRREPEIPTQTLLATRNYVLSLKEVTYFTPTSRHNVFGYIHE